ncbi:right-handed parallel beta-helix repeat-containing protein [Fodinibius salsisoli]|uniref:Right-handed parallel beta-helix repeat-containing protein n=1 Tax=Fodinibius salsisoli TaxID=2820877 RepID=A0ABT3PKS7_9BACT|nr:right-handed parallel beta-helix repeat-containing protein [Fodinibius salsisoli]MCW9706551.1 right-handed parallel beta-helix repeat-containing protein [Fodinibius salsisoli]
MNQSLVRIGLLITTCFLIWSCDTAIESTSSVDQNAAIQSMNNKSPNTNTLALCQNAGDTGMTAVYVNESVKGKSIDFSNHNCDLAIYFDENAPKNAVVRNTTVIQETGNSGTGMGLWNEGAKVMVSRSTFTTNFAGQYVPIRFDAGASGMISKNEISGTHRTGILLRGAGTDIQVKGNTISGSGAKTSGWAENGIQVDQGATADITDNEINGHWWDGESNWASTGLILWGSNAQATNNTFNNNEFGIYLFGEGNKVTGNQTTSNIESQSSFNFKAYGVLVGGTENHLAGNNLSSKEGTGAAGIYIYPGTSYSKVTGNRIKGFAEPVNDSGNDSMIRGTPASVSSSDI